MSSLIGRGTETSEKAIEAYREKHTGFIFDIGANIVPAHETVTPSVENKNIIDTLTDAFNSAKGVKKESCISTFEIPKVDNPLRSIVVLQSGKNILVQIFDRENNQAIESETIKDVTLCLIGGKNSKIANPEERITEFYAENFLKRNSQNQFVIGAGAGGYSIPLEATYQKIKGIEFAGSTKGHGFFETGRRWGYLYPGLDCDIEYCGMSSNTVVRTEPVWDQGVLIKVDDNNICFVMTNGDNLGLTKIDLATYFKGENPLYGSKEMDISQFRGMTVFEREKTYYYNFCSDDLYRGGKLTKANKDAYISPSFKKRQIAAMEHLALEMNTALSAKKVKDNCVVHTNYWKTFDLDEKDPRQDFFKFRNDPKNPDKTQFYFDIGVPGKETNLGFNVNQKSMCEYSYNGKNIAEKSTGEENSFLLNKWNRDKSVNKETKDVILYVPKLKKGETKTKVCVVTGNEFYDSEQKGKRLFKECE